jgi:hypothetical protein
MEVGLMLEEIQVAPSESCRVKGLAVGGAKRAGESGTAGEIEIEVKPSGLHRKTTLIDQPRWQES